MQFYSTSNTDTIHQYSGDLGICQVLKCKLWPKKEWKGVSREQSLIVKFLEKGMFWKSDNINSFKNFLI